MYRRVGVAIDMALLWSFFGKQGSWMCPPPAGLDHDWVMILESPQSKVPNPKSKKRG
jgi:hypothetical protein